MKFNKRYFYTLKLLMVLLLCSPFASAGIMLTGGYTHTHELASGGVARGLFTLKNTGKKAAEVKLYMEDSQNAKRNGHSNLSWVSLSLNHLIIPPGGAKNVTYTINSPSGKVGTYWSSLIVEPINNTSRESEQRNPNKQITVSIEQIIRHAITIVTNFKGGQANVVFSAPKMERDPKTGKRMFSLVAYNTGTAWVGQGVQSWIDVYDNKGNSLGKLRGKSKGLFPKVKKRFSVDINQLKSGQYKGLFAIAPKNGQMFGADVNINIQP